MQYALLVLVQCTSGTALLHTLLVVPTACLNNRCGTSTQVQFTWHLAMELMSYIGVTSFSDSS